MRIVLLILTIGVMFATSSNSGAAAHTKGAKKKHQRVAQAKSKKTSSKKVAPGDELQTDVKFDDNVLHGQYQTPDEILAKVENEKGLQDLLGVRKHFKDRLSVASEQE